MTPLEQIPALVDRVRRELVLARFVGKLVVDSGLREARARLDDAWSASSADASEAAPSSDVRAAVDVGDLGTLDDVDGDVDGDRPRVDDLALSDYDQLPSAHIVAKLDGLDAAEREAIERYERSGRHRRTILGKLERIRRESDS